jgi:AraC-like DNA-binding protein
VDSAAASLGIRTPTLLKRLTDSGIEIKKFNLRQHKGGRQTPAISNADLERLKSETKQNDDWLLVKEAAESIGIGINTLLSHVRSHDMQTKTYRTRYAMATHISRNDFETIKRQYQPPKDTVSLATMADQLKLSVSTLKRYIEESDTPLVYVSTINGRPKPYVSIDAKSELLEMKRIFASRRGGSR